MKGVRHENEIYWSQDQLVERVRVASKKVAIAHAHFGQTLTSQFQQVRVNVDRRYVGSDFRDLQGKLAVARTQVYDLYAGSDTRSGEYAGRIRPQGFPPTGGRHFGAQEKAR